MRRRLVIVALASAALVVVAFAVPLAGLVRSVARDRAITAAERDAAALTPVLALSLSPELIDDAIARTDTGADGRITVWLPDRTRVGDPTPSDPDLVDVVRSEQRAFSQTVDGDVELYAPVITGTGDVSVTRTRVPAELLGDGVGTAWLALTGVGLAVLIASGFVADRMSRSLTLDADELKATADQLASGMTDARAARSSTPELDAAGRALNALADRIDELRTAERERVADLSHRLRTPLTALRLDAERVADPALIDGVDRLHATVTEIIRTARRPLNDSNVRARCDAVAVATERAEFWSALAEDDHRTWSLDTDEAPCLVTVSADDLGAALDVLLGNVFAHTTSGTDYRVSVLRNGEAVVVSVDDSGEGLPPGHTERGVSNAGSTGLGLSIATGTAAAAGGRLETGRSRLGGARITMILPST
ncbi:MAG: HAMP domain-containing sensor histidine kinase [Acidimicrobiales bacterium]|nr:HAMP domain-containing sensor histidine kinase [Acidimicrobiales bacterium]